MNKIEYKNKQKRNQFEKIKKFVRGFSKPARNYIKYKLITQCLYSKEILIAKDFKIMGVDPSVIIIKKLKKVTINKDKKYYYYVILSKLLNYEKCEKIVEYKVSKFETQITANDIVLFQKLKLSKQDEFKIQKLTKEEAEKTIEIWENNSNMFINNIEKKDNLQDKITLYQVYQDLNSKLTSLLDTTSQKYSIDELININKVKSAEYISLLFKTNISQSSKSLSKVMLILDGISIKDKEYSDKVLENSFNILLHEKMDINIFLNLLSADKYESIYSYYNKLFESLELRKIRNFDYDNQIEYIDRGTISSENIFMINEEENLIYLVYNGQYILFKLKNMDLKTNKGFTPGFSVLKDYLKNCKPFQPLNVVEKEILQDKNEQIIFNTSSGSQDELLELCSRYLGIKKSEYVELLLYYNTRLEFDGNMIKFKNNYYLKNKPNLNNSQFVSSILNIASNDILETDIVLFLHENINYELSKLDETQQCFKRLFETMQGSSVNVITYSGDESMVKKIKPEIVISEKSMINDFYEPNFYLFDNFEKDEQLKRFNTNDRKEIYEKVISTSKAICDKLSKSKITKEEIYQLSLSFKYVNKKAYQICNVTMRDVIELINMMPINKERNDLACLIKHRLGDYSVLISSILLFARSVEISEQGNQLLKSIEWSSIDTKHWIDVFSRLSLAVKTSRFVNGYHLEFIDFKNMQYIENFIGQLGSDGKKPKEIAQERMYSQMKKRLIGWGNDTLTEKQQTELADRIAYNLFCTYWTKVFSQYKKRTINEELPSIIDTINNRAMFATPSSTGGIKSGFTDIEWLKQKFELSDKFIEEYKAGQSNKISAFLSENDEWFHRVLFDMPVTICNMVPKPKEFAKQRYIYGVFTIHYIWNSIATYHFENFMNHYGILQKTDDTFDFFHNFSKNREKGKVYNCIDYSVFNDQHEKQHKQAIWYSYRDTASKFFNIDEMYEIDLIAEWMIQSCELMWLRFTGDRTLLVRHEGRLFSGERSTTFVNSMMSVFYMYLIQKNTMDFINYNKSKSFTGVLDRIEDNIITLVNMNKTLGDDNILQIDSENYSRLMNEMALISGFVLKTEKCMIGINVSEFLRKIDYKQKQKNIKKGFVCRSIISFIAGNLEGAIERNWNGRIVQIYDQISTIVQRGGDVLVFEQLFELLAKYITSINRKFKDICNQTLPTEWLYTPKANNGLGLFKLSNWTIFVPKYNFLQNKKPQSTGIINVKNIDKTFYENKIKPQFEFLSRYGKPNYKNQKLRINTEYQSVINSNMLVSRLYTDEYLLEQKKVTEHANKLVKCGGNYSSLLVSNKKVFDLSKKIEEFFDMGVSSKREIVKKFELLDKIDRCYNLIIPDYSKHDIIQSFGGTSLVELWKYKNTAEKYNVIYDYVENTIYNEISTSVFIQDVKGEFTYKEKFSALRLYFENNFSKY